MQGEKVTSDDQGVIHIGSQFAASVGNAIEQQRISAIGCQEVDRASFSLNDAMLLRHGVVVDAPSQSGPLPILKGVLSTTRCAPDWQSNKINAGAKIPIKQLNLTPRVLGANHAVAREGREIARLKKKTKLRPVVFGIGIAVGVVPDLA